MKACLLAMHPVGQGPKTAFVTDPPGIAVHLQRSLTVDEQALLPQGWMEIEAVDELGPCITIPLPG